MLNTFEDLILAVQDDMNLDDNAPMYPLSRVKRAINRAYAKSATLFKWAGTEHAMMSTTQANQEYYDYPQYFWDDSIFMLQVNGILYGESPDGSPTKYDDYLRWRADTSNTNSTTKKWATQKRRFFIHPVPTTAGVSICVWGHKTPDALSANGDTTIFSYSMPQCNEAINLEAQAILRGQGEEEERSVFRSTEAKQILVVEWNKIKSEQSKYEKIQPFLDVPDMFKGKNNSSITIGNFDID